MTVHAGTATGTLHITGNVRAGVTPGPDATVGHRLDLVEQWLDRLDNEVDQIGADLGTETGQRKAEDMRLADELPSEIARLEREIEERDRESVQINARALPVVGFGIALSGVPENLAAWAPLGLATVLVGVALSIYALALVIEGRPWT